MTDGGATILHAEAIAFGFPQRPRFLRDISLTVAAGQCWGILGPNGAGKSTLLRLLAGLLTPHAGAIRLLGTALGGQSARGRARVVSFLPQNPPRDVDLSARQIVLMGRYPHRALGIFESAEDHRIAGRAMSRTETAAFSDRSLASLSGGEAQRVHIAAALAQQPRLLLLDEPTNALDLYHQLLILRTVRGLTDAGDMAAVVVTHDLNLAARFCTHALLLDDGRAVAIGRPDEVLTPARLEGVYGVSIRQFNVPGIGTWTAPLEPLKSAVRGGDT